MPRDYEDTGRELAHKGREPEHSPRLHKLAGDLKTLSYRDMVKFATLLRGNMPAGPQPMDLADFILRTAEGINPGPAES
jgi:hypothetical protein